jgi:Tfp pilus assembly protein PilN
MTARVNLLPWREQQRLKRRRRFVTALALTLIFAVCATLLYTAQLEKNNRIQKTRQHALQQHLIRIVSRANVQEEFREELKQLHLAASALIKVHTSMVMSTALLHALSSFQGEHSSDDTESPFSALNLDTTLTHLHFDGTRLRLEGLSRSGSGVSRLGDTVSGINGISIPDESIVSLLSAGQDYQFRLGFPATGTRLHEVASDDD